MSKSTLVLIVLATLALGALIGVTLGGQTPPAATSHHIEASPVRSDDVPFFRYIAPGDISVALDPQGQALPVAVGENFVSQQNKFKSEAVIIRIDANGQTEYKAVMQQGDTIVYSWETGGAPVYYDFHAHDKAFGDEFFTRYAEGEATTDSGAIMAAYSGQHGWYLRNPQDKPVRITLQVAGYFDRIIKVDLD